MRSGKVSDIHRWILNCLLELLNGVSEEGGLGGEEILL